jgi:predicted transcriptional regulator
MSTATPIKSEKDAILKVVQGLPESTCIEEVMEKLFVMYKVEKGLKQVENGEMVSNEEAKARFQKWFK